MRECVYVRVCVREREGNVSVEVIDSGAMCMRRVSVSE